MARSLLVQLEAKARRLGYAYTCLDTGAKQPHAMHLYVTVGYEVVENSNGHPWATFFGMKRL